MFEDVSSVASRILERDVSSHVGCPGDECARRDDCQRFRMRREGLRAPVNFAFAPLRDGACDHYLAPPRGAG